MWGVRPWDEWTPHIRERLLAEDPDAIVRMRPASRRSSRAISSIYAWVTTADGVAATDRRRRRAGIVHKETVPPDVLRLGRRLRLIEHLGLDYRGILIEVAGELGIPVAATPLVNYLAVAEHTWALILNYLKQLPGQRALMQARGYHESWGGFPNIGLARDMTLGLLGFGEIARPVARIAQAFEMRTVYWDISRFEQLEAQYGVEYVAWDELFRRADVVSVHLALNELTQGIIGAREIGLMKPAALFINTARGKLVDQAALTEALRARRIGGAALDVFAEEPLPADDPLHELHGLPEYNVTLTPHSAWQSPWTWVRDLARIWLNVIRMLRDEAIEYLV